MFIQSIMREMVATRTCTIPGTVTTCCSDERANIRPLLLATREVDTIRGSLEPTFDSPPDEVPRSADPTLPFLDQTNPSSLDGNASGFVLPPAFGKRRTSGPDSARDHFLYKRVIPGEDGFFHCPWEGQDCCNHKREKLKCNAE
jgi:hypothetical protein